MILGYFNGATILTYCRLTRGESGGIFARIVVRTLGKTMKMYVTQRGTSHIDEREVLDTDALFVYFAGGKVVRNGVNESWHLTEGEAKRAQAMSMVNREDSLVH